MTAADPSSQPDGGSEDNTETEIPSEVNVDEPEVRDLNPPLRPVEDEVGSVAVANAEKASGHSPAVEIDPTEVSVPEVGPVETEVSNPTEAVDAPEAVAQQPPDLESEITDIPPDVVKTDSTQIAVVEPVVEPEPVAVESPAAATATSASKPDEVPAVDTKVADSPEAAPTPAKLKPSVKVLEGLVTAVSSEEVDLDLPDGRKAVIYRRNFGLQEEDPSTIVSVGDRAIGAELSREDPKSRVVMSRTWVLKKQNWEKLEASAAESKYISGKVVSTNKNGLVLDVGVRAFVPASHVELVPVKDLKPYVGRVLEAKIIEINPTSERLVLSRRPVLLREQRKKIKELLSAISPGDVRTGVVASLAEYGAFVDLGGVKGLVHVSELAWERVNKPSDVLNVGDEVEVKVLDLNIKKRRIGLSIRQLKDDPLSGIEVGSVITGRVTRLVDFGAFVDLGVIEGLAHLSELAEYRIQAPEEVVTPGDEVRVKVLSVDSKRRRVALSVRQAAEFGG